jgi:putative hemolysin
MELLILFLLIVLNGALVLSEMAIVASRKARLQHWSDEGRPGAKAALALANEPGHFLSTTQIGITVIGIVSGAFAAETVAKQLADLLAAISALQPYADRLSLGLVVSGIALCSLVLGELVPKRIALLHPEAIASAVARPMRFLSWLAFPVAKAMNVATDGVLRLFGSDKTAPSPISQEEIGVLMRQGAAAGVFDQNEQVLVARVFRMGDWRVTSAMTPRVDICLLDLDRPFEANRATLLQSSHSRFPLCQGGLQTVVGIVRAKGLLDDALQGKPFEPRLHAAKPLFLPDSLTITDVLEAFKKTHSSIALVVDEYGEIQGLVTMTDIMQALVGDIDAAVESAASDIHQRDDGSWLVDGAVSVNRLSEVAGIEAAISAAPSAGYDTVGGFVLAELRRMPRPGDRFDANGYRFEVIDVDNHRVDKLLISSVDPGAHTA